MNQAARRGRRWLCAGFASPPKVEAEEVQVGADAAGNVTAIWRNDSDFKDSLGTLTISSSLLPVGASAFIGPTPVAASTKVGGPRLGVTKTGAAVGRAASRNAARPQHIGFMIDGEQNDSGF